MQLLRCSNATSTLDVCAVHYQNLGFWPSRMQDCTWRKCYLVFSSAHSAGLGLGIFRICNRGADTYGKDIPGTCGTAREVMPSRFHLLTVARADAWPLITVARKRVVEPTDKVSLEAQCVLRLVTVASSKAALLQRQCNTVSSPLR